MFKNLITHFSYVLRNPDEFERDKLLLVYQNHPAAQKFRHEYCETQLLGATIIVGGQQFSFSSLFFCGIESKNLSLDATDFGPSLSLEGLNQEEREERIKGQRYSLKRNFKYKH